jgi:hypothetical protein
MANPFHIDLLKNYVGGDITTPAVRIKSGAMGLFITAPDLQGGTLTIQQRPYTDDDSGQWYSKATSTFTVAELDANNQAWVNTLLAEGEIRAVLSGTGGPATIAEVLLRPTHETEIEL